MHSYRADIDGLRAICIVAVVMFHAGFDDWRGGYIGVDVFFVISGYLITSLIKRQLDDGRFELLSFYERRIRRLLVPTIPVIVFTTLFAWGFGTTETFLAYSKSLIAFAAYVSNWYFLATTGYFTTHADVTPLLHTWSLAVEEQFYFIFSGDADRPEPVQSGHRPGSRNPRRARASGMRRRKSAAGNSERAFFSLFSRFWELMAGALLALRPLSPATPHASDCRCAPWASR